MHPQPIRHVAAAAVAAWTALATAMAAEPAPRLVCNAPVFDYGTVENTRNVDHTFTIRNEGNAPLVIDRTRTTCGCTRADLSTNTIAAGETATLATSVSLRGRTGRKEISVYVHSNDPAQPIFQLRCVGAATAEIELTPASVEIQVAASSAGAEETVFITNRTSRPIHITEVLPSSPALAATLATNAPGRAYTLTVRVVTNFPSSQLLGYVRLTTDHPDHALLIVPVTVRRETALEAIPSEVVFIDRGSGQPPETRYLTLRSPPRKAFQVEATESNWPGLVIEVQKTGAGWALLKIGPVIPSAAVSNAAIRVRTDIKEAEWLEIPIRVLPAASRPTPAPAAPTASAP